MAVKEWTRLQIWVFWLSLVLFAFPIWVLLARGTAWLAGRYPYQEWFPAIPIVLAFVVVFSTAAAGLSVTWRWLDSREVGPEE